MRKLKFWISAGACLWCLASPAVNPYVAGNENSVAESVPAASVNWSPIAMDSVSAHEQKLVKKKHLLEFTLNVQLPAAEEKLADPVRAWWLALLTGQTGIEPDGPLTSGDEVSTYFRKAYMDRGRDEITQLVRETRRDTLDHRFNYAFDMTLTRVYETKRFVTFRAETYAYSGGAHGVQYREYATFRKSDGHLVSWRDLIEPRQQTKFSTLVVDGLENYFGVVGFAALSERLQITDPYSRTSFPLPKGNPGLLEDGLCVQYDAYEIAPYAAGQPLAIVPYASMKRLWSKVGLSLWK